eukprot:1188069-Prorocentrum_minimum.AAC.4
MDGFITEGMLASLATLWFFKTGSFRVPDIDETAPKGGPRGGDSTLQPLASSGSYGSTQHEIYV